MSVRSATGPDFFSESAADKQGLIPVFLELLPCPRGIECLHCGPSRVTRFQKSKRKRGTIFVPLPSPALSVHGHDRNSSGQDRCSDGEVTSDNRADSSRRTSQFEGKGIRARSGLDAQDSREAVSYSPWNEEVFYSEPLCCSPNVQDAAGNFL